MFIDTAKITVRSGNGGNGAVSFHTAKYLPNGGPDGGDGGKGGDVILIPSGDISTLRDFRYKRKYFAQDGENGQRRNRYGKGGEDLRIILPVGTVVRDNQTGRIIADLKEEGKPFVVATGGRGGKGNAKFANSVRQAPNFARAGEAGEELELFIELKLLADVGLIGFPNVGKSTLLSVISAAKPKIADYHFTTLMPNLGVVDFKDNFQFVVADIPGLIEGAGEGSGLGHKFLRHVERTKMFIHVLDVSGSEGRDPVSDFELINNELEKYKKNLSKRPQVIAANKIDIAGKEQIDRIVEMGSKRGINVFPVCAPTGKGIDKLINKVAEIVRTTPSPVIYDETDVEKVYRLEKEDLFTIEVIDGVYHVKGKWVENLVDSTNFDDTYSIQYFQRILRKKGVIDALEAEGIRDFDSVVMHTLEFEYLK